MGLPTWYEAMNYIPQLILLYISLRVVYYSFNYYRTDNNQLVVNKVDIRYLLSTQICIIFAFPKIWVPLFIAPENVNNILYYFSFVIVLVLLLIGLYYLIIDKYMKYRKMIITEEEFAKFYINKINSSKVHLFLLVTFMFFNDNAFEEDLGKYIFNIFITLLISIIAYQLFISIFPNDLICRNESLSNESIHDKYKEFTQFPGAFVMLSLIIYSSIGFNLWLLALSFFLLFLSFILLNYTKREMEDKSKLS